jgi:magnesium chelatase family protein
LVGAVRELGRSTRAHHEVLRIFRTLTDLAGEEKVSALHLSDAIQYRRLDRSL